MLKERLRIYVIMYKVINKNLTSVGVSVLEVLENFLFKVWPFLMFLRLLKPHLIS